MYLVQIPLVEPIIKFLLGVPVIGPIVEFLMWEPVFAVWFLPGLVGLFVVLIYTIWWERKAAGRVQWRYGPLQISRRTGGIIQPVSDLIRYMLQEIILPDEANMPYFLHVPVLAFFVALTPLLFLPAGPHLIAIYTPYNILIVVVLLSIFNLAMVAMGWASNDKWAFIGTVREALVYVSYEVSFMASVISMLILYATADPFRAVSSQSMLPGAIMNPVAFLLAIITTAMATDRYPFEIVTNESDVVAGPFTEYGGLMFGLTMTVTYEKGYIMSLLISLLFLGGWSGPYIWILGDLSPAFWLGFRVFLLMMFFSFLRAVYPNYRLDQVLKMGWKTLLALSVVSLIISMAWRGL